MTQKSAARLARAKTAEAPPETQTAPAVADPVQTVVHKPGDRIAFKVSEGESVIGDLGMTYFFRVMDLTQRANYKRDIVARRGQIPDQETQNAVIREGIEKAFPEADREASLAIMDEIEDWQRSPARWVAEIKTGETLARRLVSIQAYLRRVYPPYPQLEADGTYARDIYQVVTLQHTLAGWEGVGGDFRMDGGLVHPESLMAIPQAHYQPLVKRAQEVVRLTQATIKN